MSPGSRVRDHLSFRALVNAIGTLPDKRIAKTFDLHPITVRRLRNKFGVRAFCYRNAWRYRGSRVHVDRRYRRR